MIVALASDHAGIELKGRFVGILHDLGHEAIDLGPIDHSSVDYPDFAHALVRELAAGRAERGVLVCGTGIGMSMTANRHEQIRAALCHDAFTAEMARRHNDANVVCIGARVTGESVAEQILHVFLDTTFEGGRHKRRVAKITPPPQGATEES